MPAELTESRALVFRDWQRAATTTERARLEALATPPRWTETFARCYDLPASPPAASPHPEEQGLWPLVAPLANDALRRVREIARELAGGPIDPDAIGSVLEAALPRARLRTIAARTVVLELNVARLRGELAGDTPEERYSNFLRHLGEPEYAARLLESYPVLARQLVEALDAWVTCQAELLTRLRADWDALSATLFEDETPGALVAISPPEGDPHRGGRAVLVARFAGGQRVVYKPRSLAGEAHFQALLGWLNARLDGLSLASPEVLDRGAYGWCAFASRSPCANEDEVRTFYARLGGLAAVLTVLDATDMHSENLVAAGAHPMLVDLECLFQPRAYAHLGADGAALDEADEFYTVLRTGILPARSWLEGHEAGVDTSALGAIQGQALPDPNLRLCDAGTDTGHFVSERATLDGPANHAPRIAGGAGVVRPEDYAEDFVAGFTAVYRCVLAHREELRAPSGPLEAFAGDEVRVLVRDTRTYGLLLDDAFHPDYLRDARDRDGLFDRLWAEVARRPYLAPLVPSEHADLHARDIPMFTTRPDALDLWDSRGGRIPGLFRRSSLEMVRRQVARLGEIDLARQTWAIRASLDTLRMNRVEELPAPTPRRTPTPADPVPPAALLAMARGIGDHLDALAMRGEAMACWAGVVARRGVWSADIVDHSFHTGTGGIALFLASLGRLTGEARYERLARQAAEAVRFVVAKRCREGVGPNGNPGLDYGWGGAFYVVAALGAQWATPRDTDILLDLIPVALADVARHPVADVAQGACGSVLGLLAAWRASGDGRFRDAAIVCGERVLALARVEPDGVSWANETSSTDAMHGLARGAAGIAHALGELARATCQSRFHEAAAQALAHHRARAPSLGGVGWASGASGSGLVSLDALRALPDGATDATLVAEVGAAIEHVSSAPFGRDHSLGEGDAGRLELLLQAREHAALGELSVAAACALESHLARLVAQAKVDGWRCGLPLGRETPGLVSGLAGIGHQLLRAFAPDRVAPLVIGADAFRYRTCAPTSSA